MGLYLCTFETMESTGIVQPRRMGFIDIIRGLAAVLVAVLHQQMQPFMHDPAEQVPPGGALPGGCF